MIELTFSSCHEAHTCRHHVLCSWLPLFLGEATLYLDACPKMSYFLAGALITLAFNLLHTFSMVIAFDGLREGKRERWAAVPIAHLLAALLVSCLIYSCAPQEMHLTSSLGNILVSAFGCLKA